MKTERNWQAELEAAVPPMPDDCYQTLMQAARSVKEDEPVKRNVFCTAAIALTILCLTVGVAFGARELLEPSLNNAWQDVAAQPDMALPQATDFVPVETEPVPNDLIPVESEPLSWQVGPLTVTLIRSACDDTALFQTIEVRPTDGSQAVLMPTGNSLSTPISVMEGSNPWGLSDNYNFVQASKLSGVPMYCVTMMTSFDTRIRHFDSPKTGYWDDAGSLTLTSRITDSITEPPQTATLYVRVYPVDTLNSKIITDEDTAWILKEDIPVGRIYPTGEATYTPTTTTLLPTDFGDVYLRSVTIQLQENGGYLYTTYEPADAMSNESLVPLIYAARYTDQQGVEIADGLSEYYNAKVNGNLYVTIQSIELRTIPDGIVLFDKMGQLHSGPVVLQRTTTIN